MKRQVAAAGDLPQAGNARLDAESFALDTLVKKIDIADGHGARPHQAHFPTEHIKELR